MKVSCPNIFFSACPKIKWFCPNITCFFPENCHLKNSSPSPPPPPATSYAYDEEYLSYLVFIIYCTMSWYVLVTIIKLLLHHSTNKKLILNVVKGRLWNQIVLNSSNDDKEVKKSIGFRQSYGMISSTTPPPPPPLNSYSSPVKMQIIKLNVKLS